LPRGKEKELSGRLRGLGEEEDSVRKFRVKSVGRARRRTGFVEVFSRVGGFASKEICRFNAEGGPNMNGGGDQEKGHVDAEGRARKI